MADTPLILSYAAPPRRRPWQVTALGLFALLAALGLIGSSIFLQGLWWARYNANYVMCAPGMRNNQEEMLRYQAKLTAARRAEVRSGAEITAVLTPQVLSTLILFLAAIKILGGYRGGFGLLARYMKWQLIDRRWPARPTARR